MAVSQKQLHAIVSGIVQGVSFRYYTTRKTEELGITGWVRNNPDRTVEVVAEGEQSALEQLEMWLHEGSPSARVDRVDARYDDATGEFVDFRTIYYT
ncbi:MAG: acylphosphatase [Chloroflexota bacterium]